MREFSNFPWDDGSRRILRCPPSHQEMALTPHYVHASAWVAQLSHPPPPSTVSTGQVSPYHQWGSTMQSVDPAAHSSCHIVPFVSMGGECPQARPQDCLDGWMACPTPLGCQRHLVPLTTSCPLRTWGGMYASRIKQLLVWVNGTLARYHRGGNAITKLGQSFFASLVSSLSIHHKGRGVLPNGSDCYAVGKGDSIQSPDSHC
jgi:hypothetical protein